MLCREISAYSLVHAIIDRVAFLLCVRMNDRLTVANNLMNVSMK
jgi:hypothetical protein